MDEELLQAATSKLEFRDIVLHTCKLDRSADLDPLLYPALVRQRAEHEVVTDRLYFADADHEEVEILRNYIRFLISAFEKPAEDEPSGSVDDTLLFSIEAEYNVEDKGVIRNILESLTGMKREDQIESLVCIGRDDHGFESVFNTETFIQKISITQRKTDQGLFDPQAVKGALLLELGR